MGYPTFRSSKATNDVVLNRGISPPYEDADLQLHSERDLTRGGSPYITQWSSEPTRLIRINIDNITNPIRNDLYTFFDEIGYTASHFYFFPEGIEGGTDDNMFSDTAMFSNFFDNYITDSRMRVRLWQDKLNIPIKNAIKRGKISNLQLLVEEEIL